MTVYLQDPDFTLYHGDVLETLRDLPDESVDCVITSPPYWGLRDYGTGAWEGGDPEHEHETLPARNGRGGSGAPGKQTEGAFPSEYAASECSCGATRIDNQLGLEPTPEEYVTRMVEVFREVRRVLAKHGTCFVNMGDSYAGSPAGNKGERRIGDGGQIFENKPFDTGKVDGLKPKDLCGIPWRLAFALQADGWYLRSDIIWAKPNPMPESVTDRPTKAHEYVFLLTKSPRYFFDQEAVRESAEWRRWGDQTYSPEAEAVYGQRIKPRTKAELTPRNDGDRWNEANGRGFAPNNSGRNIRSVWEIATQPFPEAHFATFPEELVRRCLLAGCPEQVCGECGVPRTRIVSAEYDNEGRTTNGPRSLEQRHETAGFPVRRVKTTSTEGFTDCGHDAYRPGVCLDPFLGSGTVALVARKHGRRCVGIELNEAYCEMAAKRLAQQSLFA